VVKTTSETNPSAIQVALGRRPSALTRITDAR
jgi:hypothetical protein